MTNTGSAPAAMAVSAGGNLRLEPTALPVRLYPYGKVKLGWHPVVTPMPAMVRA